jgi:hypothetical protein
MATKFQRADQKASDDHRVPVFMAMLFGTVFTILLLPAYGQQEVDPSWYDPWATPGMASIHPSQSAAAVSPSPAAVSAERRQPVIKPVSPSPDATRLGAKESEVPQGGDYAVRKNLGTGLAENHPQPSPVAPALLHLAGQTATLPTVADATKTN